MELLIDADLKNKILLPIPRTPFHLLGVYRKDVDGWDLIVLELTSEKRRLIGGCFGYGDANYNRR